GVLAVAVRLSRTTRAPTTGRLRQLHVPSPNSICSVASAVYFASDGLHPTGAAYALCCGRLKPATRLLSVLG
ncbi:MAG: hypothetical protein ACXW2G_06040, partial [Burkholderiaceae bacterium]